MSDDADLFRANQALRLEIDNLRRENDDLRARLGYLDKPAACESGCYGQTHVWTMVGGSATAEIAVGTPCLCGAVLWPG